jgi:hypothetical protein
MAKKQTIASEITSALGAVAARAEQLVTSNPVKKTTKPAAKRTTAAKHSTTVTAKRTSKPAATKTKAVAQIDAKLPEPQAEAVKLPVAIAEVAPEAIVAEPVVAATVAPVVEAPITISREAIAEQAYLYWEARGRHGGDPLTDWVRAEEELKRRALAAKA